MMKKLYCLLLLVILSACNHGMFKTPLVVKRTTSVIDGVATCIIQDQINNLPPVVWPIESCNNAIGVDPVDYLTLFRFYDDKLKRLEICIKHPKKCQ